MKKIHYVLCALFFYITVQANNSVVEKILNARSKQEARQIYTKVFKDAYTLGDSKKYLAWLGRLYKKSCQQIEDKKNDQAVLVMAQGLRAMVGSEQQAQANGNDTIGNIFAEDMQRRALLIVGPYWPIDNETIERIIMQRRLLIAGRFR